MLTTVVCSMAERMTLTVLFQELEEQPQYQHLVAVDPLQSEESAENKHEENLVQPPPPPPAPSAASQEMPTPVQFKLPLTLDFDDLAGVSESSLQGCWDSQLYAYHTVTDRIVPK